MQNSKKTWEGETQTDMEKETVRDLYSGSQDRVNDKPKDKEANVHSKRLFIKQYN